MTAAVITPSSRIVALDDGALSVRVFAADGKYITSLGRPGEGPGEFPMAHLGEVATPRSLSIFFISGNRALGGVEDSDGEQTLLLHELRKPGG